MRIVAALGGNALLRRGEPAGVAAQRRNVATAARALAPLAADNELVVTHGNGPQVGLLALQAAAAGQGGAFPLDVLDAESEGMIGYLIEQELMGHLGDRACACLLTQVEVALDDPAFAAPSKPIGPVYGRAEAARIVDETGWTMAPDGDGLRRVVASPAPLGIVELAVIDLLVANGIVAICLGGGGIPVARGADGRLSGVEAVVDKDSSSALLACDLAADRLLLLTDVPAVVEGWGSANQRRIRSASPAALSGMSFDAGSMGPKVRAASAFATATGRAAVIGALGEVGALLRGAAGTTVTGEVSGIHYWD